MEHEARLVGGPVGRIDGVDEVDDLREGESGGGSGRFAEAGSRDHAVGLGGAVAGCAGRVHGPAKTRCEGVGDLGFHVESAVLHEFPGDLHLRGVLVGVHLLLAEGEVLHGDAAGLCDEVGFGGGVVFGGDVERVALRRADDAGGLHDAAVILHGAVDLVEEFGIDGVAAEGGGADYLVIRAAVLDHEGAHLLGEAVGVDEPLAVGVAVGQFFHGVFGQGAALVEVLQVFAGSVFFELFEALLTGDPLGEVALFLFGVFECDIVVGGGLAFGPGFFSLARGDFHLFDDGGAFLAEFNGICHSVCFGPPPPCPPPNDGGGLGVVSVCFVFPPVAGYVALL